MGYFWRGIPFHFRVVWGVGDFLFHRAGRPSQRARAPRNPAPSPAPRGGIFVFQRRTRRNHPMLSSGVWRTVHRIDQHFGLARAHRKFRARK